MGAFTFDMEVATQISPAKMFKAFVLDAEKLIVKVLPQAIKSVATLEGNGGPGTIRLISSATAGWYTTFLVQIIICYELQLTIQNGTFRK